MEENMIKTHALFQLLSDVRFLTNIFIYVKHGRVLRPGIAHETGTPPSCRNSKLTMTPTSSIVPGKDCNWQTVTYTNLTHPTKRKEKNKKRKRKEKYKEK